MNHLSLSISEAKEIDLVSYLNDLGFRPEKVVRGNYWYLSPLREEKHASFQVNRKKNLWYDFGIGEGGTIIDFAMRYHHCSIAQCLEKLQNPFAALLPPSDPRQSTAVQKRTTRIISVSSIINPALCHYLRERKIPLELARQYCSEVHYRAHGKQYFAIGFKNKSGGYELRSARFKGCIAPKDVTIIRKKDAKAIAAFEGFFSFLSYLACKEKSPALLPELKSHYLILNSLALFKKNRKIIEAHDQIHLFLDLDPAGNKATEMALGWDKRYHDERQFYQGHKDLNEMLVDMEVARHRQQVKSRAP